MVDGGAGHPGRRDVLVGRVVVGHVGHIVSTKDHFDGGRDSGRVAAMVIRSVRLDWQSVASLALVAGFFVLALIP